MPIKKPTTTGDIKTESSTQKSTGETVLIGPNGYITTVPDSIVDVLIESGYKRK